MGNLTLKNGKQLTMLTIVKPVILVNQFLGVCPHEIQGEILIFRAKSLKFIKTLFTIAILLIQLTFTTFQFSRALINGQSMIKLGFLFAAMTAPGISLLILAVTLQKRDQFTHFFVKCQEFKSTVCMKGITNCPHVIQVAWRFYAFYMFLALIQAFLVAFDTLKHPTSEIYALYYVASPSPILIAINCFYQFYLIIITQSACALVEVLCASVSCSIVNNIGKIQNQMKDVVEQENKAPPPGGFSPRLGGGGGGSNFKNNLNVMIQLEKDEKNGHGAYGIPYYPTAPLLENKEEPNPTEPIMTAIQRYSYISQKQRLINCIFGSILALDIAWLVIHVCLLFFLQIKSLGLASGSRMTYSSNGGGNDTFGMNETMTTAQSLDNWVDDNFYTNTSDRIGFFAGQGLIYLLRLMIVLISLGNVHETTRWFDSEITSNLMKVKKPKSSDLQLIQVHLLGSQSNPVAFSAGGFFIFSRATILYVFSIVTTYVIFMLQA